MRRHQNAIASLLLAAAATIAPATLVLHAPQAAADPAPNTAFVYQGALAFGGQAVNGVADFRFRLFDSATGGSVIGSELEATNLEVQGGVFSATLDFGTSPYARPGRHLEISVRYPAGEGEFVTLTPRQPLSASFEVTTINTKGGSVAGSVVGSGTAPGSNAAGEQTPTTRGSGGIPSGSAARTPAGLPTGRIIMNDQGEPIDHDNGGVARVGAWEVLGDNIFYQGGNVGIGIGEPIFPLHVTTTSVGGRAIGGVNFATTGISYGIFGQSNSDQGRGLLGIATSTTGNSVGLFGQANSTLGRGLIGLANASSGEAYGVLGQSQSSEGRGIYGISTSTSGVNYGVFGQSNSSAGIGVAGRTETANPSGNTIAVSGIANSFNAVGVFGRGNGDTTGAVYGVLGVTSTVNGFGVFSNGNTGASGAKSFVIDHPSDPANKVLVHYSAESPEPYLLYRGSVTLDDAGRATVSLPAYFQDVNRDPHYQLTAVGAPAPNLHIASKVENNTFIIAGGAPGMEVSWTVTGVRNDRWMQANPPQDERLKPASERGTYLHPELYGQPASKGTFYTAPEVTATPAQPVRAAELGTASAGGR